MLIEIYTENLGSNPGGKAIIPNLFSNTSFYLKYCSQTRLNDSVFCYQRQPIYEALTLAGLRNMGLSVPEFYLIDNSSSSISFEYKNQTLRKLDAYNSYFLLSKIIDDRELINASINIDNELSADKKYRDFFLVGDVSNKQDNFRLKRTDGKIVYIDVGCNFVDCHGGVLSKRNVSKVQIDKKRQKAYQKRIKKDLISFKNGKKITLENAIEECFSNHINIIDTRTQKISSNQIREALTDNEIEEIRTIIFNNIVENYKLFIK